MYRLARACRVLSPTLAVLLLLLACVGGPGPETEVQATTASEDAVEQGDDDAQADSTEVAYVTAEVAEGWDGRDPEGRIAGVGGALVDLVQRFPTLDAPPQVQSGAEFDVRFALTLLQEVTGVDIVDGVISEAGGLVMSLPEADFWDLDVVLMAPGFESLDDEPLMSLRLPKEGDSNSLSFKLRAPTVQQATERRLLATLWHGGKYQGKVARAIQVLPAGPVASAPGGVRALTEPAARLPAIPLALVAEPVEPPDLTVFLSRDPDDELGYSIIVYGPGRKARKSDFQLREGTRARLMEGYRGLSARGGRGGRLGAEPDPEDKVAYARGVGEEIWVHFAPAKFKEAYWEARSKLGDDFDSLHVFTEDPLLPWELMTPVSDDRRERRGFLGTELLVARWPLGEMGGYLETPPLILPVHEVVAVAPRYEGEDELVWQSKELQAMGALPGYRRVGGKMHAFRDLVRAPPRGIVHFAGHGRIVDRGAAGSEFSIQLEDGRSVDLTTWKGLNLSSTDVHPLYFFNACEVGQAENVAGFVDGWAPAVLANGASGYIGTLWPVGDKGASEFAVAFYEGLSSELEARPAASVGMALRDARKLFYETGDPTFLAYVYYGDPGLQLQLVGE